MAQMYYEKRNSFAYNFFVVRGRVDILNKLRSLVSKTVAQKTKVR